ncbi:MAG: hypothetical protein CBC89_01640 [Euryarchaeota archaeon TMED129]|nr:MAG: hypothetical protein CBC89_01640 [Euryarchaeota archaeon TMED129]
MPQQTNLNVAPYFDDFDATNDYHKVLFKPGFPVQARELTTLQSILQNQIERFGQHFFKEGTKVIPGNTGYSQIYYCVQLENTYQGVPVAAYVDQLIGTKITGQNSGVTAFVDSVLLPEDSERGNLTLYINYLTSSTANNSTQIFSDGEPIVCNEVLSSGLLGNSTIAAGTPLAVTLETAAAATGSVFQIDSGVYFIRGNFVNVNKESLVLDQYTTTPSYRIGLLIDESVVTADIDEELNDNSQGFNNYAAPGADRLRISVRLFKKALDDFNDDNFILLATVINGVLQINKKKSIAGGGVGFNDLTDVLARRTFDESGHYYAKPFDVTVVDSLNNRVGNGGIFNAGQFSPGGATVSNDLALYKISPGKAYVKGYEIESLNAVYLDVDKPRTTKTIENQSVIYNTGPTLKLNRVYRNPTVGLGNTYFVSLRNQRIGSNQETAPGNEVGVARVYDFRLESGSYNTSDGNQNQWNLALYDIQTNVELSINQAHTLSTPTFVKGANSGATGFLRHAVSAGTALTVYESEGSFIPNERLIFNGVDDGRIAIAVTEHNISDAKSVYGMVGYDGTDSSVGINTFSADVVQSTKFTVGIATISPFTGGVSTVRSNNPAFPGTFIKENDLVQYTDNTTGGLLTEDPIIARVVSVGTTHIDIEGVTAVAGISSGLLPTAALNTTDFKVITTDLASSSDDSLFTPLPKVNVSEINLDDASLTIRKTFDVTIASNELSTQVVAGTNETFLPFDEERYLLIRKDDGTTEALNSDQLDISPNGKTLQIRDLGSNSDATLTATLKKIKPKAKQKIKNRVSSLIIDKSKLVGSGIGTTTLNNGLTHGSFPFGTRVEDEVISLNTPDVIKIHGIYESADTSAASCPQVTLQAINTTSTTTQEFIIGERFIGQTSGAVAIVAEKLDNSNISFIRKNEIAFIEGETVEFEESLGSALVSTLVTPSFNISSNYSFQTGQEKTFYDHGRIRRKVDSSAPSKQLKIYFMNATFSSTDDGDVITANSYEQFDLTTEIKDIDLNRNTDIIDIRPRVSTFVTASTNNRSPLEFLGRSFTGSGQSATNVLASDEAILTDVSYFQGRIDRVYLTKEGKFQIMYGTPSDSPVRPDPIDDAIEICRVQLPPFLYDTSQASLSFMQHKRYQMQDIKKLEDRIKSLEYYTTLSLLEKETANFFIPDDSGLNRFKSGFFVDNFNDFQAQELNLRVNNSIDRKFNELRPRHYTNSVDLVFGPVVDADPTADLDFADIEGNNVRKENDVVTLDYSEVEFIRQNFATRTESVTPFLISFWNGTIELTPSSDNWVDTTRLDAKIIETEGNYNEVFNDNVEAGLIDPQTGFGPMIWDSWETNWTGVEVVDETRERVIQNGPDVIHSGESWRPGRSVSTRQVTDQVIEEQLRTTREFGTRSRSGVRTIVTESFDMESVGDRVVSRDLIPYMRSRNVEFVSKKMKPLTRMYGFFDGVDITEYCVPKLLEITMTSGTFQVGETVIGSMQTTGLGESSAESNAFIRFRTAQHNHREGPYDAPTKTYVENPYLNLPLSVSYSSTSTILNVDTFSLASQARGDFYGWVKAGMTLIGSTSGAIATVENVRLISDLSATLIGSYYIPDPNNITFPRFECGTKTFTLTNDIDNNQDNATTIAEESFAASGTLETVQENIISVRNARVELKNEFQSRNVNRDLGTEVVSSRVVSSRSRTQTIISYYDPLAQSFLVEDETGVFLTSCDVFFRSKDDMDVPVVFQLRTMENGTPTARILPFSEIVLDPNDIETSGDGSIATNIKFKAPVYVEGGTEYAVCLASNSTKYSVYISRIGENDLLTDTFISNQPYLGSLFKSQNASTWEPSQWEDLKFTLYRADFLDTGSVEFYSPELTRGNAQIAKLTPDPIVLQSRSIRVGLGTTVADSYEFGNTFTQATTNASGDLVGTAGSAVGNLSISNAGLGYTPADGGQTFSGVNLVTLTGNGRGATADITVRNGSIVASGATINNAGGSGYQVGDVVGITTIGAASVGRNARLTIAGIGVTNELILNNVQGEFAVGAGKTLFFNNSSGISTELNSSGAVGLGTGGDVQIANIITDTDGLHFKVNHQNHGMYFSDNSVSISGVLPDVKPTKLTAEYSSTSTDQIVVGGATTFSTFEGVGVGTTNVGYLLIGDEIIEYTNVSGNSIGGNIVRGADPKTYPVGTPVYKYELGGINLDRINRTHDLSDVTRLDPFTFDSYQVKIDTSGTTGTDRSTDVGFPKLYITGDRSAGGSKVRASQNMPFEIITPQVQNVTVPGTSITAELRTTTTQSFSGNEIPFVDAGFQDITINQKNYFDTPRMIASKVNEDLQLTNIVGGKSMQMRLFLSSTDTRISPVIDSQRVNAILTSNRVNNIISNYATDPRVNSATEDPTAFQYFSKEIVLENPASSIKVIVAAHINEGSDIRAFFATNNKPGLVPVFTPFPGYANLNERGEIIASENNNGESDSFITKSNILSFESRSLDYREYTFTIDRLPSFRTYRIKLALSSTSQCFVPRVKELRVIALA